jgi:hypothetical protein
MAFAVHVPGRKAMSAGCARGRKIDIHFAEGHCVTATWVLHHAIFLPHFNYRGHFLKFSLPDASAIHEL